MRINSYRVAPTSMPGTSKQTKKEMQKENYNAILEAEAEMIAMRKEIDNIWATHSNKHEAADILCETWMPKLERAMEKAQKAMENWSASLQSSSD